MDNVKLHYIEDSFGTKWVKMADVIEAISANTKAKRAEGIGWAFSHACELLDAGQDQRNHDERKLLRQADNDFRTHREGETDG